MKLNNHLPFSIIIPVFNEEKNINILVNEIKSHLQKYIYEIIIYNDGSIDFTKNILGKIVDENITIINSEINKGQSHAIFYSIKRAKYRHIVTIDGDGQNNPKDIITLFNIYFSNRSLSLVGGIRIKRHDSYIKIISSKIANFIRMKIFNDNCKDTGCSLKIFDGEIFKNFPYFDGMHRFIPALFSGTNHSSFFINVSHRPRLYGFSNYNTIGRLLRGIRDIFVVKNIIKNLKNDQLFYKSK